MWNSIIDVLKEKVTQGVDVRIMYDDFGCIRTLPHDYVKQLEAMGIQACIFNKFVPIMSSRFNNRDHRKICVIDGNVGFTGGVNMADEYINEIQKYGHWLDSGIMLKGQAVWSLTVMFLSMWDYTKGIEENYQEFAPDLAYMERIKNDGFVQPFTDTPHDDEAVGENVYLNLINKAKQYVHICTPYLIIDNEMITALCTAAKSTVDVKLIVPHHPETFFIYESTRSYYQVLIEAGVKIYEYTPGFIHSKTFVVDDEYAVCGTINLDYRSLYLHFECATWMYQSKAVMTMEENYQKILSVSQEITLEECLNTSVFRRLLWGVLRVFAPLL